MRVAPKMEEAERLEPKEPSATRDTSEEQTANRLIRYVDMIAYY